MPPNRQTFTQADIESFHWVKFNGLNGEILYALSGIILVNTQGHSQNWLGVPVTCKINIPELPAGQGFFIHYHAPFAALNSIFNQGQAVNGGHSVNTFTLVSVHPDGNYGSKDITLAMDLAVSDSDAYLFRVGFNITFTGILRPLPPVDPCKAEADKLSELQNLCNGGYERMIESLQARLGTASPAEKPGIIAAINDTKAKLHSCPVDLAAAQSALDTCRTKHPGTSHVPPVSPK